MWINLTYPIYNWGYNPLTKWDEPPSSYNYCYVDSTSSHEAVTKTIPQRGPPRTSAPKVFDFGRRRQFDEKNDDFSWWFNGDDVIFMMIHHTKPIKNHINGDLKWWFNGDYDDLMVI